jgi:hypothetical protein
MKSFGLMVCAGALLAALAVSCSQATTARSPEMHARVELAQPASLRTAPREPLVSNGVEGGREHAWVDDN